MRNVVIRMAVAVTCTVLAVGLMACGGGSSSSNSSTTPTTPTTPTNRAPTISTMTVTSFGVSELSTFQGSVSASDPDGDSVSVTWDIGGISASGTSWSKTLIGNGTYTARVTVSDTKGASATDTRSFTVGSMTGNWTGILGPAALGNFRFTLTQTLSMIQGTYWDSTYGNGKIDPAEPGSINSNGTIKMRVKQGPFTDWYFDGTMDPSGWKVTGTVRGSGFTGQPFAMTK